MGDRASTAQDAAGWATHRPRVTNTPLQYVQQRHVLRHAATSCTQLLTLLCSMSQLCPDSAAHTVQHSTAPRAAGRASLMQGCGLSAHGPSGHHAPALLGFNLSRMQPARAGPTVQQSQCINHSLQQSMLTQPPCLRYMPRAMVLCSRPQPA